MPGRSLDGPAKTATIFRTHQQFSELLSTIFRTLCQQFLELVTTIFRTSNNYFQGGREGRGYALGWRT
jgi:hypothetical protein